MPFVARVMVSLRGRDGEMCFWNMETDNGLQSTEKEELMELWV